MSTQDMRIRDWWHSLRNYAGAGLEMLAIFVGWVADRVRHRPQAPADLFGGLSSEQIGARVIDATIEGRMIDVDDDTLVSRARYLMDGGDPEDGPGILFVWSANSNEQIGEAVKRTIVRARGERPNLDVKEVESDDGNGDAVPA